MTIWAIADLHLSFDTPNKKMDVFGSQWINHAERVEANWKEKIDQEDLVLIAGDISWALHLEKAIADLKWIHELPGTKVMIRGNHDYWWESMKKLSHALPSSIHAIHNNSILWHDYAIGGSRLWDTQEYNFGKFIPYVENPLEKPKVKNLIQEERIFNRELNRLKISLQSMPKEAKYRIAMTHYPPIGADLAPSQASNILEEANIDYCIFGHLHNVKPGALPFGVKDGTSYILSSCDYLEFDPIKIC